MTSRPIARRWAFWLVAFTLLLKSAAPLFAAASAHAQGRTLVEICTVYGVATVELGAPSGVPERDRSVAAHVPDACVLAAVVALGTPAPAAAFLPTWGVTQAAGPIDASRAPAGPDADAAWVAWLQHAPPRLA